MISMSAIAQDDFVDQSYSDYQEEFEAPETQTAYQQPANGAEYQTQEEKISPDPSEFEKNGVAPQIQDEEFSSDYTEEY
jgi:hypothetical protein